EYGIIKKSEEQMISYEVVYEPDTKDAQNQWMSKETLEKACEIFNENLKRGVVKSNLFHVKETDLFTIEDTWIQKEFDVVVDGTDQPMKAGTWIAKLQFNDPGLWQFKKSGVLGGVFWGGWGCLMEETGAITDLHFNDQKD